MTRWAIRLTLAYALLFQAMLGAAAGTIHALSARDALAGVLCAPSGEAQGAPNGDRTHDLLCCTLGCAAAQPAPSLDTAARSNPPMPLQGGVTLLPPTLETAQARAASISFEATGPPARA